MLNHEGQRIRVTVRTLRALDVRGYLQRNRSTGLLQLTPQYYPVFCEVERFTEHFHELGADCSGANQVVCNCEQCKADHNAEAGEKAAMEVMERRKG